MAYELQKSFAAGELTPKSWLRDDIGPLYAAALKTARNVICLPHGPVSRRKGFEFIEELVGETSCRLFDFDIDFDEAFVVAITTGLVYILDRNGFTLSNQILINSDFSQGQTGWTDSRVNISGGIAAMNPNNNNPAWMRQEVTGLTDGAEFLLEVNGIGPSGSESFEIRIGSTAGLFDIAQIFGTGREFSTTITPGAGVTSFWFEVWIDSQNNGGIDKAVDTVTVKELVAGTGTITFPSTYTEVDIQEIHIDKVPGNRTMYIVTRGHQPMQLTYVGGAWSFDPILFAFGAGGAPWGIEFPGCITFHDGRMALGGTYSLPVHVWLSKPRKYTNFDLGDITNQLPDDALELPLDKNGTLHWLRSNTQLFAGLDSGEHVIFGTGAPLSPGNAQTNQQSSYGSARIHAIVLSEQVIYVDTQGRIVRGMKFSDSSKAYSSDQISFQAEHITKGGVREFQYGISPIGQMYFPTFDGDLVTASIEEDQSTLGWQRHDTQGDIISATVLKEFGRDVPWLAVLRNDRIYIERYDMTISVYMDSYLEFTAATEQTNFLGFDHLIGQTVQIVADGVVHPDRVVNPDGSIDLQFPALEVIAGLGYESVVETLPELGMTQEGSTMAHNKRFSKIAVYLLNSPLPIINGYDTYKRTAATSMGTREAAVTGIVEAGDDGWSTDASIVVSQNLPIGMSILGIGGKLKANKL